MHSPEALEDGQRGALAIFSLDRRSPNKFSRTSALRLLTSKALGNYIDLGSRRHE
jgi:hypothetical protein